MLSDLHGSHFNQTYRNIILYVSPPKNEKKYIINRSLLNIFKDSRLNNAQKVLIYSVYLFPRIPSSLTSYLFSLSPQNTFPLLKFLLNFVPSLHSFRPPRLSSHLFIHFIIHLLQFFAKTFQFY